MSLSAPPRPTPPLRGPSGRRVPALLIALTIGAMLAVGYVAVASPGLAASPAPAPVAVTAPVASPLTTRGVVVASSSCTDPGARDLVEFRGADGVARTTPLDACGTQSGAIVMLTVADGQGVAHLAGTGSSTADAPNEKSPMTSRLAVTLGAVAALGMAGLLLAVGRERLTGRRRPGP